MYCQQRLVPAILFVVPLFFTLANAEQDDTIDVSEAVQSTYLVGCVVTGLFLSFYGYHFLCFSRVLAGFSFGSSFIHLHLSTITDNSAVLWTSRLVVGAVLAFSSYKSLRLGIAVLGAAFGVATWNFLRNCFPEAMHSPWIFLPTFTIFAVLGGISSLKWEKLSAIVCISTYGAEMFAWALTMIVSEHEFQTFEWNYVLGSSLMLMLGVFTQWKWTAMGDCDSPWIAMEYDEVPEMKQEDQKQKNKDTSKRYLTYV